MLLDCEKENKYKYYRKKFITKCIWNKKMWLSLSYIDTSMSNLNMVCEITM